MASTAAARNKRTASARLIAAKARELASKPVIRQLKVNVDARAVRIKPNVTLEDVTPASPMHKACMWVDERLSRQAELLDMLLDRLAPILSSDKAVTDSDADEDEPSNDGELVQTIRGHAYSVEVSNTTLEDVLRRLSI